MKAIRLCASGLRRFNRPEGRRAVLRWPLLHGVDWGITRDDMTAEEIRTKIAQALPGSRVEVRDTTGGGDHFEALVVADQFADKTMIEQHRMVYSILGEAMAGPIHALALRTSAPAP